MVRFSSEVAIKSEKEKSIGFCVSDGHWFVCNVMWLLNNMPLTCQIVNSHIKLISIIIFIPTFGFVYFGAAALFACVEYKQKLQQSYNNTWH